MEVERFLSRDADMTSRIGLSKGGRVASCATLFRAATQRYDTYENGMAAAKAEAAKPKGSRESRACAPKRARRCPLIL